jgi:prepilin-type N-terminal cleavage/methylation domain-containing protein
MVSSRRHPGFTLVELLVVIAVMAILGSLVLGVIGSVRFRARALQTTNRIEAVLNGISNYAQDEGSTAAMLQLNLPLGGVGKFASMVAIDQVIKAGGGSAAGRQMPPLLVKPNGTGRVWAVYSDDPTVPTPEYYHPGSNEDFQQSAYWKLVFDVLPPSLGPVPATYYLDTWPTTWPAGDWMKAGTAPPILRYPWGKPGLTLNGGICDAGAAPGDVVAKQYEFKNPTDATHESGLDAWRKGDFNDPQNCYQVAILNSCVANAPSSGSAELAFSVADATQTSAITGPITATRSDGSSVQAQPNQPLPFDLGYLSPLRSSELLIAADILPRADGAARYRSDRGANQPWNDAWGRPLVASYALFQPERFQRTWDRLNRRDLLLKKALDAYGYNRSFYIAVGAVGPEAPGLDSELAALSTSTSAASDAPPLAAAWKRIAAACDAATWTETTMATAPWHGIKIGKKNGMRAFLSAPLELR